MRAESLIGFFTFRNAAGESEFASGKSKKDFGGQNACYGEWIHKRRNVRRIGRLRQEIEIGSVGTHGASAVAPLSEIPDVGGWVGGGSLIECRFVYNVETTWKQADFSWSNQNRRIC